MYIVKTPVTCKKSIKIIYIICTYFILIKILMSVCIYVLPSLQYLPTVKNYQNNAGNIPITKIVVAVSTIPSPKLPKWYSILLKCWRLWTWCFAIVEGNLGTRFAKWFRVREKLWLRNYTVNCYIWVEIWFSELFW